MCFDIILLYKKQIRTHREKKHVLTLTLMLVRRKSACETSAGSSKIFRWLAPLLGPNLDPKTGPKQRPKRRNENVIQFWTPFWGPYLDPKMVSAIGEFRCCPQMFCKQICDPAAWTWMSTHTFSLCASQGRLLLSRFLYGSHVLSTFFGPVLGAMIQQVCWHSRRSEAHRGLPEARPRTQNVMARGQSEAHGDSNLYNTRQDWMSWNQKNAGDDHQPRYPLLSWKPAVQNEDTCPVWDLNFKAHADFRPSICSVFFAK